MGNNIRYQEDPIQNAILDLIKQMSPEDMIRVLQDAYSPTVSPHFIPNDLLTTAIKQAVGKNQCDLVTIPPALIPYCATHGDTDTHTAILRGFQRPLNPSMQQGMQQEGMQQACMSKWGTYLREIPHDELYRSLVTITAIETHHFVMEQNPLKYLYAFLSANAIPVWLSSPIADHPSSPNEDKPSRPVPSFISINSFHPVWSLLNVNSFMKEVEPPPPPPPPWRTPLQNAMSQILRHSNKDAILAFVDGLLYPTLASPNPTTIPDIMHNLDTILMAHQDTLRTYPDVRSFLLSAAVYEPVAPPPCQPYHHPVLKRLTS